MKFLPSASKISNAEASQVFRQFAFALGGALQGAKSARSKPQKTVRARAGSKPAAKRASKRVAN